MKARLNIQARSGEQRCSAADALALAKLKNLPANAMPDARPASLTQLNHQELASNSFQTAQLNQRVAMMAGRGATNAPMARLQNKDLPQVKFIAAQCEGQDKFVQAKLAPVQRDNDEMFQVTCAAVPDSGNVAQREAYMRAVHDDDRVAVEIASLQKTFNGEISRQNQVNSWVSGFAGMPTTRYAAGKARYFSPVGYRLETVNAADVLANFTGDGNTNDIPITVPRWVMAMNHLIDLLKEIPHWVAWRENSGTDLGDVVPVDANEATKNYCYEIYVRDYLLEGVPADDADAAAVYAAGHTAVLGAIETVASTHLTEHYGNVGQEKFVGAGLNPDGMDAAEADDAIPYTESILRARFDQVTGAWYNVDLGGYTATAAQDNWRTAGDGWLAARQASATAISAAFVGAGAVAGSVPVFTVGHAALAAAADA